MRAPFKFCDLFKNSLELCEKREFIETTYKYLGNKSLCVLDLLNLLNSDTQTDNTLADRASYNTDLEGEGSE